ncbi:probable G-protein coupled receptor [Esox lucius]|uniref:G-protein coupled receptors family 1 profile domain-containing protein n=1 Tax=Esox lucius TaxID=8010 RepID=A0AAY5L1R2_ESOLU|nr:probable G-protein coupled receptor [Esox lucius]XP_010866513.1 probable G-protein coupled receptor [Esox lucius]XP_012993736.1 probable G-protein coupled receptor [Esox lucius]
MEKTGSMLASLTNRIEANLTTSLWGLNPTVPAEVGVVTSSQSQIKDLIGLFSMVTLNLIALLANTGVMVAIARAPHLKRFAFVCHLCAVDLLCAILLMPLGIISNSPFFGTVVFTVLECQVYIFLNVFLICASILTITAISVERYYYIVHPMRYEMRMSINLVIGVMLFIWVKSILLALVTLFGWPAYGAHSSIAANHCSLHWSHSRLRKVFAVLFSTVCFLLPALVIFTVYCKVYKVARLAALQLAPLPTTWASSDQDKRTNRSDSINSQTTIITSRSLPQRLSPERAFSGGKAALTLVVIIGQFLLCWLPYFSFHLHLSFSSSLQSPGDVEEAVTWLAYSSFAVNPFFYGLLNRQIREELIKFRRCCSSRPVELGASSHEGSLQENFLQFIQRTNSSANTRSSCANSSRRNTLDQGDRIPGQIPEEHG